MRPCPAAAIRVQAAPAALRPWVIAAVERNEVVERCAVRILPEPRVSMQFRLADPYWIRERDAAADWHEVPAASLWGPRHKWAYGFSAGHVRVYALGLTPAGLRGVLRCSGRHLLNCVRALDELDSVLARALQPEPGEPFLTWSQRAFAAISARADRQPVSDGPLVAALPVLAASEGGAVAQAAAICGLSERQFRRLFTEDYGVPPKAFQRTLRVDRMLRQIFRQSWETDAWPELPLPFSDQPHAIREFRALTGMTPSRYLRAKQGSDATLRSVPVTGVDLPIDSG